MKLNLSNIISIVIILVIIILSIIVYIQYNKLNNLYIKSEKDRVENIIKTDSINSVLSNLLRTKLDSISNGIKNKDSIVIKPKIKYYDKQIKSIDSSGGKLPKF